MTSPRISFLSWSDGFKSILNNDNLGETPITCTAGVGTFIVEFGALSRLTGSVSDSQVGRGTFLGTSFITNLRHPCNFFEGFDIVLKKYHIRC